MRDRIIATIALSVSRIADEHTWKGARGELMRSSGGCTGVAATAKDAEVVIGGRCTKLSAQWKPGHHEPACQGPLHRRRNFTKDQVLQAWRGSHAWGGLDKDPLERGPRQGLGEASGLAKVSLRQGRSVSATERTWALHPPQSQGHDKA